MQIELWDVFFIYPMSDSFAKFVTNSICFDVDNISLAPSFVKQFSYHYKYLIS